ncbi:secreted protein [Rhodopirellula europaea 6C]|uniref:Secreted protein n=1 Tax=Rhodopirellula europaea 6C TaxID=1263867 RepID=M2A7G7_9BACT|nr:secreted protein [Rhodopirellula europaea 6C]
MRLTGQRPVSSKPGATPLVLGPTSNGLANGQDQPGRLACDVRRHNCLSEHPGVLIV